MVYLEIKLINRRRYLYERTSYRSSGRVLHKNFYIGPLWAVYKKAKLQVKRLAKKIILAVLRQIRSPRNKKPAVLLVLGEVLSQYYADASSEFKRYLRLIWST